MSSILVTCRDRLRVERTYVPALQSQGWDGELKIVSPDHPEASLEGAVGLLLTGGGDIHPRRWNPRESLHPTSEVDEERDALEIPLIRKAWAQHIPILGICRGEQVLNVALGGSLIQDIPSHFGCPPDRHSHGTPEVPETRHQVFLDPTSRLAGLLGAIEVPVNSRHHQAVSRLATGFRAVAWHRDTTAGGRALIEGLEAEDPARWAFGVQWHPENLVGFEDGAGEAARRLFAAFLKAAGTQAP